MVEVFKRQMRSLGYVDPFEEERIYREDTRRLYKLVLCAKDPLGGKIWRGIATRKPGGQRELFQ